MLTALSSFVHLNVISAVLMLVNNDGGLAQVDCSSRVQKKSVTTSKPRSRIVGGTTVVPYGARGNTATEICAKVPARTACTRFQSRIRARGRRG